MLYVLLNLALVLVAIFLPFFIAELPEGITSEQVLQNRRFVHLTMKAAEQQFPSDRFMRVHRSHIVALEKITSIDPGGNIMLGEVVIPVSESYRKGVEAYLAAHLFKEKEKI